MNSDDFWDGVDFAVFAVDLQKTVLFHNRNASAWMQKEESGRTCCDFFHSSLCRDRCPIDRLLQTGEASLFTRCSVRDVHGVDCRARVSIEPIRNDRGELRAVAFFIYRRPNAQDAADGPPAYQWGNFAAKVRRWSRSFQNCRVLPIPTARS